MEATKPRTSGELVAVQSLRGRKFHIAPEHEPQYSEGSEYPVAEGLPALCGAESDDYRGFWSVRGELAVFTDFPHLLCKTCRKRMKP